MIHRFFAPLVNSRKHRFSFFLILASAAVCMSVWAGSTPDLQNQINAAAMPIYLDRGASGLSRCLAELRTRASILMITAHPDDEDGGLLAYQTRGLGAGGA